MLVSRDVILTYINEKNAALSMALFDRFFLLECNEQLTNAISSEKLTNLDGEKFTNMAMDVRYIELSGYFNESINRRNMEAEMKQVFHPNLGGTLEYYHRKDKRRYTIGCFVEKIPDVRYGNGMVSFVINLKCLDPFWYGEEISMTIPPFSKTFTNAGDSLTGAIYMVSGSANEPFITNGTDKLIYKSSLNNQPLKITAMPDKSLVEVNGVNAVKYLTDASNRSFPMLDIGQNTISYGSVSGAENLSVTMRYKPRFLGTF